MKIKPKPGDVVAITWRDHEIRTETRAEFIKMEPPCKFCTPGFFSPSSQDGYYYILATSYIVDEKGKCLDSAQNDHIRILKSCVEKIEILKRGK